MIESDVQRSVCDLLTKAGVPWARNNTGSRGNVRFGLRIPSLEGKRETRGGGPDLFVAPRGVRVVVISSPQEAAEALRELTDEPFFMELKGPDGQLRESQRAWIQFMRDRRR